MHVVGAPDEKVDRGWHEGQKEWQVDRVVCLELGREVRRQRKRGQQFKGRVQKAGLEAQQEKSDANKRSHPDSDNGRAGRWQTRQDILDEIPPNNVQALHVPRNSLGECDKNKKPQETSLKLLALLGRWSLPHASAVLSHHEIETEEAEQSKRGNVHLRSEAGGHNAHLEKVFVQEPAWAEHQAD